MAGEVGRPSSGEPRGKAGGGRPASEAPCPAGLGLRLGLRLGLEGFGAAELLEEEKEDEEEGLDWLPRRSW